MAKVTKSSSVKVSRIPEQRVAQIPEEKVPPCRESIGTMMDGEFIYATVNQKEDCLAPSPEDKAEADNNARNNLMKYGERWCKKGRCVSGECLPTLSDIKNQGYKIDPQPKSGGKKDCVVIATISGTVSCSCK
jgi:hypothetical protein